MLLCIGKSASRIDVLMYDEDCQDIENPDKVIIWNGNGTGINKSFRDSYFCIPDRLFDVEKMKSVLHQYLSRNKLVYDAKLGIPKDTAWTALKQKKKEYLDNCYVRVENILKLAEKMVTEFKKCPWFTTDCTDTIDIKKVNVSLQKLTLRQKTLR